MDSTKTVLVVEDERPLQEIIKRKLELSGYKVLTERTVDQAIGCVENLGIIDVIWLNRYLLGRENGLDFVTKLKNHDQW